MKVRTTYSWGRESTADLMFFVADYLCDSEHGVGQIETMQREIENLQEMVAFMASAMVEKGMVSLDDLGLGHLEEVED